MKILKPGVKGAEVEQWQYFLIGEEYYMVQATGNFDNATLMGTQAFQRAYGLTDDGVVGGNTYRKAMEYGFVMEELSEKDPEINPNVSNDMMSVNWPPAPDFITLSAEKTEKYFGHIEFEPLSGGTIRITNGWDKENIIRVNIPQLNKLGQRWGHDNGTILFHKKGAEQMKALWAAWESEGLLNYVTDWCCSYGPRYIRGSETRLSNHAYGTAFDINIRTNALGKVPPVVGEKGSLRLLVPLANKYGFFWGGHYRRRKDGMHFELVKLM